MSKVHTCTGVPHDAYSYSTMYNEFHPAKAKVHARRLEERLVPNAVFSYSVSPLRVVKTATAQSLGSLLTQLCAIVGGTWTVFGVLDGILFNGMKAIKVD